jgi:hypothetical protein
VFLQILYTLSLIRGTISYGPSHAWLSSLSCGLGDIATLGHPLCSLHSWLGSRSVFLFSHWPASYFGRHNCGCLVAYPPYPPRGRWPDRSLEGVPNSRSQGIRSFLPNIRLAAVKPVSKEEMGEFASQSLLCDGMTFCRCFSTVLM